MFSLASPRPNLPGRRSRQRKASGGEPALLLDLLIALHAALQRSSPGAGAVVASAVSAQRRLSLAVSALPAARRRDGDSILTSEEWERLGRGLLAARRRFSPRPPSTSERWATALASTVGLDPTETLLLRFIIAHRMDRQIANFWSSLAETAGYGSLLCDAPDLFAMLLRIEETEVVSRLGSHGRLRASGLIERDDDGDIWLLGRIANRLAQRADVPDDPRGILLCPPRPPELPWDAFAHIGEKAELAANLLAEAIARQTLGVGILLYGPPGTGKTAFAATLAARVKAALYPVGETDDAGDEPSRDERLAELRMAQRLVCDGKSVLLFDEAEDLFGSGPIWSRHRGSRVFIHRTLEEIRLPVIWTANDLDEIGPASRRRMMMCIEMRVPPAAARGKLWRDIARSEGVELSPEDAADLAQAIPAPPAILRTAMRAASLAGGGSGTARLIAISNARAVQGGALPLPEPTAGANYDPALTMADCDLLALGDRLAAAGTRLPVSLLLSGPPGTGKSAYARHLAARMGLPALQKRGSDLFGPFVGETEARIAHVFEEARETGSFLIFDEVDSLLHDRRDAHRSWEVSQVNEMLTWMEHHPLPFVCTTNLAAMLDAASLRRFLFRIRFDYLGAAQAEAAFFRFFGCSAPAAIRSLDRLTPADFALVRRRLALTESAADPDVLLGLLEQESRERQGPGRQIGFHVHEASTAAARQSPAGLS